jgi:hypothetical protein
MKTHSMHSTLEALLFECLHNSHLRRLRELLKQLERPLQMRKYETQKYI